MAVIEADYLVVGGGATGMAFTDALIDESEADVVVVDRRHTAGGHWNDAYPFVRLHQPSAYYGVNSLPLGGDRVDEEGPNAGGYERATAAEICGYYQRVLDERMVASGRVRFFGMSEYLGMSGPDHRFTSRLTGEETTVHVRGKLVDATYLEGEVPSRHALPFAVDDGVRVIPPNDLVARGWDGPVTGYTVVGSGKTGMDTCNWLLVNGVPPEKVRWIKPRESWCFDRRFLQPRDQVASVIEGVALELQAAAEATDVEDLFRRLEDCGRLLRIDPGVEPTMFRAATLSAAEVETLRSVEQVVRLGRVRRIGRTEVVLEGGTVGSEAGRLFVDCTAAGLPTVAAHPIFEPDRITVQTMRIGLTPFNAALVGYVEATRDDDAEKNRLCPPNVYPATAGDWIPATYVSTLAETLWGAEPDIAGWLERSRLNLASGIGDHLGEPGMQAGISRLFEHRERALDNLRRLLAAPADRAPAGPAAP